LIIREGKTDIEVFNEFSNGPGKASTGFYNKVMEVSRDMTVGLLSTIHSGKALDGMAGTGIRGIRIAREAGWKVVLNDRNPRNASLMKKNAEMNGVEAEIMTADFMCAASSTKWDYIDLDPYGTPAGNVEAAISGLKDGGILGVTMTDTANLEGNTIMKGYRIYGSTSLKGEFSRELSTRIFVKYAIERGASLGRSGKVLLCIRDGHYIRTFVQFKKGNRVSDHALSTLKKVVVDGREIGPLYTGKLYDTETLRKIDISHLSERSRKIFGNFWNEDLMFLFHMNDYNGREINMTRIIDSIVARGYRAGRTNFNDKGIKTDIDPLEYRALISSL
jgi:tRNA (guanine26-N2/guanine27-N2)-dimethyltransferase